MAQSVARALLATAVFLPLWSQAIAATWVRVSVDISNLSYAAIEPAKQAGLARGYAVDIADALSLPVSDVLNLDGVAASVTVAGGSAPIPSLQPGGTTHADVQPVTSTRTTTTAASTTTSTAASVTTATATRAVTTSATTAVTTHAVTSTATTAATTATSTSGGASATTGAGTSASEPATTATSTSSSATTTSTAPVESATTTETSTTTELTTAVSTTTSSLTTTLTSSTTEDQEVEPSNSTGLPPVRPMRGVAYGALPCKWGESCTERGLPPQDMLQEGYAEQWGADGRDDLGVMHAVGGNAVRLYHSFGLNTQSDHGGFLDRAQEVGVHVMPGFHTELTAECPEFDCYEQWKEATLKGFENGYEAGGRWHPAVSMVILLNEPDFLEWGPKCAEGGNPGAWCRVRASLSALDGLLAAEKEAGVPGSVNLTIAWSFGMMDSIDGEITGPGYFGFQDMKVAVRDPQLAGYTPRTPQADLEHAYRTRWVNCLNTQAPWDYVDQVISSNYGPFEPTPWFIGEYGANGQPRDVIERDLHGMEETARQGGSFLGVVFFQFQTANQKGGSELNFGMFDLGTEQIAQTGDVCDDGRPCSSWPVWCLDTELTFLPGTLAERAEAVATAWDGTLQHPSLCNKTRRLEAAIAPVASIDCYARAEASAVLDKEALRQQLVRRTLFELGDGSAAVVGELRAGGITLEESRQPAAVEREKEEEIAKRGLPWWGWLLLACAAALLAVSGAAVACCLACGKAARELEAVRAQQMAQV